MSLNIKKRVIVETTEGLALGATEVSEAIVEYLHTRGVNQFEAKNIQYVLDPSTKTFQRALVQKTTRSEPSQATAMEVLELGEAE